MGHKKNIFSEKPMCRHRMFGCTCKYIFSDFVFTFRMCFQTIGSYAPGRRIPFMFSVILKSKETKGNKADFWAGLQNNGERKQ
jgi:hypothetical protein